MTSSNSRVAVTNPDDLPMVLTAADIAHVLGISRNTAYEYIHSRGFPSFKVGKQYRVSKRKFMEWLETAGDNGKDVA